MNSPLFPDFRAPHDWFYPIKVSYAPSVESPFLDGVAQNLLINFQKLGHTVLPDPHLGPHILLTSANFYESLNWRKAHMFTGRMRFKHGASRDGQPVKVMPAGSTTCTFYGQSGWPRLNAIWLEDRPDGAQFSRHSH